MGASCTKGSQNTVVDIRDEKTKKDYYLNIVNSTTNNENDVGASNYDIKEGKRVGYAHIQKTNLFH